ncbi:MAG: DUF4058 family protein [Gemmataceae bacterium]|nr:DUF4058 family protein [Planctomycetia bacterium]MBX3400184.1 DUF4058 family protein [Gemmataceae bacterium]
MPMHDWTRVDSGTYHDFHEDWIIELRRRLNAGILPKGYYARADQRVNGPEPDIVAYQLDPSPVGVAVADAPPKARLQGKVASEAARYARRANRLSIRKDRGRVVAIVEFVSPGNKDSKKAIREFTTKIVKFLNHGIHVLVVDPFPPTHRDPDGIHQVVWDELVGEPFGARPAGKPLTAAAYDADESLTAYVEPFAVGDAVPDMPLFLEPGRYVTAPLDASYRVSWDLLPETTREQVDS